MTIPIVIQQEIDRALEIVMQHPDSEYKPKERKALFLLLKTKSYGLIAWKQLAILSAQRVLPIYEAYIEKTEREFYYDTKMPHKSLTMAENVLLGKVNSTSGYNYANAAYEQSDFDYMITKPVPFRVYMASWTASIALLEVSKLDVDQFSKLPNFGYHSDGHFSMGRDVSKKIENVFSDGISGENFTNTLWARSGHSDTAASACTAWACEDNSKELIPTKQLEFWEWWLTDGIKTAWNRASKR